MPFLREQYVNNIFKDCGLGEKIVFSRYFWYKL